MIKTKIFISKSPEETEDFAYKIGSKLKKSAIICLEGDLGTGKTAFTKGIARALGITGHITSPTFTIINEYKGRVRLYHFDVYRIGDQDEMFDIGFEEYIYSEEGISVIEWSDKIKDILPKEYLKINIYKDLEKDDNYRKILIEAIGGEYQYIIEEL